VITTDNELHHHITVKIHVPGASPDFSPYAKARVEMDGLTGNYTKDAAMANKAVGLKSTPANMVWHHVEDAKTMLLIPRDIHQASCAAYWRRRDFERW
jgi:hypothetical protein